MWDAFAEQCNLIKESYPGYRFLPIPTETTLARFEAGHSVKLPRSFRDFALRFGAGEIAGFYRIAVPLPIENDYELGQFNRTLHGEPSDRLLEEYGSPEVIERFLFFCATGGGIFFGWNTDELTNATENEYAIYEFPEVPKLKKVATSFHAFIMDYVLKPDKKRKWEPELTFMPFQIELSE